MIGDARGGDPAARERLYERIYSELRGIAQRTPRAGRAGDTLQPTVIVNELFVEFERRFPPPPRDIPESRATFFRTVALAMRTICRDYWRSQVAQKRGGGQKPARINEHLDGGADELMTPSGFLDLDAALSRLESFNPRWFEVVMHRYFAGRSIAQTAELLNMAESTVSADWQLARAWLRKELAGESP
ncbi:MAG: sigma-70 family RNA polymerase sigma factor [Phycisphaerales bacterium]|nr:sigma-70 family RNA polymerase sigma factor [Phycisphaerales bacterium]